MHVFGFFVFFGGVGVGSVVFLFSCLCFVWLIKSTKSTPSLVHNLILSVNSSLKMYEY